MKKVLVGRFQYDANIELVCIPLSVKLQIPRDVDDRNPLIAAHQEKQFENLGALVVEWRLPPVFNDQLGNEDRDLAIGMLTLNLENVFYQRHQDEAIGRG